MKSKRIAALGAVALLALAGCGSQAASNSNGSGASAQQGQRPQMDYAALAKKLGVSEAKVKTAFEKVMPQRGQDAQPPQNGAQPSGTPPSGTGGPGGDMAATLAKELGVTEAKVQSALQDLMPQGGPPNGGGAAPSGTATSSS